jgi:microcystin-dependent protein
MDKVIYILAGLILYKIISRKTEKFDPVSIDSTDLSAISNLKTLADQMMSGGGLNLQNNLNLVSGNITSSGSVDIQGNLTISNNITAAGIINAGTKIREKGVDLVPYGIITIWSGELANIPSGWVLCDGQNGTPDLRGRFVMGAGGSYAANSTGGSNNEHRHGSSQMIAQIGHYYVAGGWGNVTAQVKRGVLPTSGNYRQMINLPQYVDNASIMSGVPATAVAGATDPSTNLPPYYALCYIMKV